MKDKSNPTEPGFELQAFKQGTYKIAKDSQGIEPLNFLHYYCKYCLTFNLFMYCKYQVYFDEYLVYALETDCTACKGLIGVRFALAIVYLAIFVFI